MRRERGRRFDSGLILLLTPLIWGATFPAGKIALRSLPVLSFMAWSRVLGSLTILALLPILRRAAGQPAPSWRRIAAPGLLLGALMFAGYYLQTAGLARTTATNAGFITGLYIVFTPLLGALLFRHRTSRAAWGAIAVGFAGLALLSVRSLSAFRLHQGDLLVLAGAVVWAGHITAVGRYSPRYPAWMLSLAQMAAASVFHLAAMATTGLRFSTATSGKVLPLLLLTGALGSGVAFTIQVVAQRTLTPARAVILLAGESVFSAFFSAIWIGERLSTHQWVGAGLVLAAVAWSELAARRSTAELIEPAAVP